MSIRNTREGNYLQVFKLKFARNISRNPIRKNPPSGKFFSQKFFATNFMRNRQVFNM